MGISSLSYKALEITHMVCINHTLDVFLPLFYPCLSACFQVSLSPLKVIIWGHLWAIAGTTPHSLVNSESENVVLTFHGLGV